MSELVESEKKEATTVAEIRLPTIKENTEGHNGVQDSKDSGFDDNSEVKGDIIIPFQPLNPSYQILERNDRVLQSSAINGSKPMSFNESSIQGSANDLNLRGKGDV